MDIIKKLADLANKLDKKGLYGEASMIDELIKSAEDSWWDRWDKDVKDTWNRWDKGVKDWWSGKGEEAPAKPTPKPAPAPASKEEELVDTLTDTERGERYYGAGVADPEWKHEPSHSPEAQEWARRQQKQPAQVSKQNPKVRQRMQWAKYYNNAVKGTGKPPISPADAQRGTKKYWSAIRDVKNSGAKTLKEYARKLKTHKPSGPAQPPKPVEPQPTTQQLQALNLQVSALENVFKDRGTPTAPGVVRRLLESVMQENNVDAMTASKMVAQQYGL